MENVLKGFQWSDRCEQEATQSARHAAIPCVIFWEDALDC